MKRGLTEQLTSRARGDRRQTLSDVNDSLGVGHGAITNFYVTMPFRGPKLQRGIMPTAAQVHLKAGRIHLRHASGDRGVHAKS